MREVLWQLGFATRLIFYERREAEEPSFAELLLNYKVDVVIWFLPRPKIRETAARLADHGIRIISVADSCTDFGEHQYRISRQVAFKEALADWQESGVSSVIVVRKPNCDAVQPAMIERCLREIKMPYTTMNIGLRASRDCLRELLIGANRAIVFPSSELAVEFRRKYPAYFVKLLYESRVMLTESVLGLPDGETLNGAVDVIDFDWEAIANRIGSDLLKPTRSLTDKPVTFEARWVCETWINR